MNTQIDPGAVGALAETAKRLAEWATRLDEATLHDIAVTGRRAVILENLHRERDRIDMHINRLVVPTVAPECPVLSAVDLAKLIEGDAREIDSTVHPFPERGDNFRVVDAVALGQPDSAA